MELISSRNVNEKKRPEKIKPIIVPVSSHYENDQEKDCTNKLWMIVRYMRGISSDQKQINESENQFEIRGGEHIRLGRIIFTVTEINTDHLVYKKEGEKEQKLCKSEDPFQGALSD